MQGLHRMLALILTWCIADNIAAQVITPHGYRISRESIAIGDSTSGLALLRALSSDPALPAIATAAYNFEFLTSIDYETQGKLRVFLRDLDAFRANHRPSSSLDRRQAAEQDIAKLESWLLDNLSETELEKLEAFRVNVAFASFGVFAYEIREIYDSMGLATEGIGFAELSSRLKQRRLELVATTKARFSNSQEAVLDEILSRNALTSLNSILKGKQK